LIREETLKNRKAITMNNRFMSSLPSSIINNNTANFNEVVAEHSDSKLSISAALAKVQVELDIGVSIEKSLSKVLAASKFEISEVQNELDNLIDNDHQHNDQNGKGESDDDGDDDSTEEAMEKDDDDEEEEDQDDSNDDDEEEVGTVKNLFKNNDKLMLQLQILQNTIATLHEWKEKLETVISDYVNTISLIKPGYDKANNM
jgi:cobalamin biosynthesis protein CobT